jgi:hypothetical protein
MPGAKGDLANRGVGGEAQVHAFEWKGVISALCQELGPHNRTEYEAFALT